MLEVRTAGLVVAISHVVRSLVWPDVTGSLSIEINQFRAEITRAELTLTHTTAILESCTLQSNFLTFVLKVLIVSEGLLVLWITYLLLPRPQSGLLNLIDFSRSADTDHGEVGLDSSSADLQGDSTDETIASSAVARRGPLRPSDLRRLQSGQ